MFLFFVLLGLGDPYMILFAETMLNLYDRTKKRGCLVDAVLGLEMALKVRLPYVGKALSILRQ